jgi:hypothetical protein
MQSPSGYNSESKQTKYEIARVNTVRITMEPRFIELLPSPKSNKDIAMSEFNGRLFIMPLLLYVSTEIRSNSEMEEEGKLISSHFFNQKFSRLFTII